MEALIQPTILCPKCNSAFEKQRATKTMRCSNPICSLYHILYKIPSYKLQLANEDNK